LLSIRFSGSPYAFNHRSNRRRQRDHLVLLGIRVVRPDWSTPSTQRQARAPGPALSAAWATATFTRQPDVLAAVDIVIPPLMFKQNVSSIISLSPKDAGP
jgi:hypothetical protein